MALAGAHTLDPRQSQPLGGDGDGGGGGARGGEGGGAAYTRRACGCKMGSPEMPEDSARTQMQEEVEQGQSDANHVLAMDWARLL